MFFLFADRLPVCGGVLLRFHSEGLPVRPRTQTGIEAVHMHYICKKCGSEITEEFTLTDVFIDNGQ